MDPRVVGDRFVLEDEVGEGGMGTVYRARDRVTGERAAVKLLQRGAAADRFLREADVLASLTHPAIVKYLARGTTDTDEPFLAMEWLDGEDLASVLATRQLRVDESVAVASRAADALAFAHAHGVVHRDIKPANLFLPGGSATALKVLDFGIARRIHETRAVTQTGTIVGTVGYMAPEQVRGERDVDARADVFALGCVLFECLTGTAAYTGDHMMAVAAKILLEEPPRLRDARPDLPLELDALVARMLARRKNERLPDAASVVAALRAIAVQSTERTPAPAPRNAVLTSVEQRPVSIIAVGPTAGSTASSTATWTQDELTERTAGARDTVARFGASLEVLADGSMIAAIARDALPTEHARHAVQAALALRGWLPGVSIAVATGRGVLEGRLPMGLAIDRAVSLLRAVSPASDEVVLDDATAALVESRFTVRERAGAHFVARVDGDAEAPRTLLGKATAYVGREREIALLTATFEECARDGAARAVLVTAPAGMGKSRLRQEFERRVHARGEPLRVLRGRGDSLAAGSPFGLLSDAIRTAADIRGGEQIEAQRTKLEAFVGAHLRDTDARRATAFIGEMVGVRFDDDWDVQLRAARSDPVLLGDQISDAWTMWLRAELGASPLLLVLEDLHWGDLPSIRAIDGALRTFRSAPLMVLALARPDIHDVFPKLWDGRDVSELKLGPLSRRACERLVRDTLGAAIDPAQMARLVDRADGNAFYLEELIRRASLTDGEQLPETVIGMVQARLSALDPDTRRALRAASVFGETFWQGGVSALVGGGGDVASALRRLADVEVIARRAQTAFANEVEWTFRHAIVRESAYAMLTDEDRVLGHRLAGEWLAAMGEPDAKMLAEHFERGGDLERAAGGYLRAAEAALEGADMASLVALAERGLACARDDRTRGALHWVWARALRWRGQLREAIDHAREAVERLERNGPLWYAAIAELVNVATRSGQMIDTSGVEQMLLEPARAPETRIDQAIALARAAAALVFAGAANASQLLEHSRALGADVVGVPMLEAQQCSASAAIAMAKGDPRGAQDAERTVVTMRAAGDHRSACAELPVLGMSLVSIGQFARAREVLEPCAREAEERGLEYTAAFSLYPLALATGLDGALDAGIELARQAVDRLQRFHVITSAAALATLARLLAWRGDAADAIDVARRAVALHPGRGITPGFVASVLGLALARAGQTEEALAILEPLVASFDRSVAPLVFAAPMFAAHVIALDAAGRGDDARHAAQQGLAWFGRIAERLDPSQREPLFTSGIEIPLLVERAAR